MKPIILVILAAAATLFSQSASAGQVVACNGQQADYSDATIRYKWTACNHRKNWQSLGSMTRYEQQQEAARKAAGVKGTGTYTGYFNSNAYNSYNEEYGRKNSDNGDNGVMWRTVKSKDANGNITWSEWKNSGEMYRGEEVQFKFSVWRSPYGSHEYDKLKSWIDWSGNNYFYNASHSSEILIDKNWMKNHDANDQLDRTGSYDSSSRRRNSVDLFREYTVTRVVPMIAKLGDIWMRARITCSHSLAKYSNNFDLLPWGYQNQGEVEDFKLTIASRTQPVTPVPEPSTLIFFTALLGVMLRNRGTLATKA